MEKGKKEMNQQIAVMVLTVSSIGCALFGMYQFWKRIGVEDDLDKARAIIDHNNEVTRQIVDLRHLSFTKDMASPGIKKLLESMIHESRRN